MSSCTVFRSVLFLLFKEEEEREETETVLIDDCEVPQYIRVLLKGRGGEAEEKIRIK